MVGPSGGLAFAVDAVLGVVVEFVDVEQASRPTTSCGTGLC